MKKEELLKGISNMLKKHEEYLNANPDVFYAIQDRLFKAIDDEYDPYDDEGDRYGDELFDTVPSEDYEPEEFEDISQDPLEAEADKILAGGGAQGDNVDAPEDGAVQQAPAVEEPKRKKGRNVAWAPRDDYSPEHQAAIKELMDEGWSHREAERMAGAYQGPTNFYHALKSNIAPSEPSPKMLEEMKGIAHEWLKNANRQGMLSADASLNPNKFVSGSKHKLHSELHDDYNNAKDEFLNSDDYKNLKGRDAHKALLRFSDDYLDNNPEYHESLISAAEQNKNAALEAKGKRSQRKQEGIESLLTAGQSAGRLGESYSEQAAGGTGPTSDQMAAQMVGGAQNEKGYQANIEKDPAAVFAERNPEYIKHLKKLTSGKLKSKSGKIFDEASNERMGTLDAFKKKGSE